jgi:hypothetical protein
MGKKKLKTERRKMVRFHLENIYKREDNPTMYNTASPEVIKRSVV